jgi:chloride channel protein, CIC family
MVDRVNREMLQKNLENVVVFESAESQKAIGVVRANDILQLRRWFIEEETRQPRVRAIKKTTRVTPS